MRNIKGKKITLILLATLIISILSSSISIAQPSNELDFRDILDSINYSNIVGHIEYLSNLGSRVTGYPGSYKAALYIYNQLKSLGINVTYQHYNITVPIDYGSKIFIHGTNEVINAYTLWPNFIQTCRVPSEKPITGKLIYVGDGRLDKLTGLDLNGSIAIMDFNSQDNWINVAKLGAQAVIFIEPYYTTYSEALYKFKTTPIHFPRVWVSADKGEKLINLAKENKIVSLTVDMRYEIRDALNIIGFIQGEKSNESIIIAAHYDTWSIVPAIAPGADEASSVASLLEIARYFSTHKPKRNIIIVALSGHWEALAGAREFVENYFFSTDVVSGKHKIWLFIGLDFSTDGKNVAVLYRGYMYNYGSETVISRWNRWLSSYIFKEVIPALNKVRGIEYKVGSGLYGAYGWWAGIPVQYMLDSEAFSAAHGLGITIRTNYVSRRNWGHPLSTMKYFDEDNLKPQMDVALSIIYALINREMLELSWLHVHPAKMLLGLGGADFSGFVTVRGEVLFFNFSKGWYSKVPNAIVALVLNGYWYSEYPFSKILTISDSKGKFIVHGVWGFQTGSTYVEAYKINKSSGFIEYAPDLGLYGIRQVPFIYQLDQAYYNVSTVVFKASSLVLFDLIDPVRPFPKTYIDPRLRISYTPSPYLSHVWTSTPFSIQILDFSTLSEYITFGYFAVGYEDTVMVFAPPRTKCMIIYRIGGDKSVLVNASGKYPEGNGFYIYPNSEQHISVTAYKFTRDILEIIKSRYTKLKHIYVENPFINFYYNQALEYYELGDTYLRSYNYEKAYPYIILSWNLALHAYAGTMSTIMDTLNVNLIFFVFLVPFIIFGEMLFLSGEGKRKIINVIILGVVLATTYYIIAPPPKVAQNFAMSPLSVLLEMLYLFVALLFLNEVIKVLKETRRKMIGLHFAEKDLVSTALITFSYSIRNMRKRKVRTFLVLVTIITVTFAMVSFTSISMIPRLQPAPVRGVPTFKGILLKGDIESAPANVIDPYFVKIIRYIVGTSGNISVRVWYYPMSEEGKSVETTVQANGKSYTIKAILGLNPEEFIIHKKYIPYIGFPDKELRGNTIVLPDGAAKALNVTLGDTVYIGSYKLVVVGIYNSSIANLLKELDNYPFTPINPDLVMQLRLGYIQQEEHLPLSWSEIVVVPSDLAYDMGGYVASIAIQLNNNTKIRELGEKIAYMFRGPPIYLSDGEKVYTIGFLGGFGLGGFSYFLGPLIIGSLTIFMTILGGIKERVREIFVYTAVGLSPTGIIMLFIGETLVYSLTGVIIGYLLGTVANIYLTANKLLPSYFIVNASSFSVSITFLVTLGASIF